MRKSRRHNLTAIIYDKRGRVLSIGKNSYTKTHPLQAYHARRVSRTDEALSDLVHKIFIHAELDAVLKCSDLDKAYKIRIFRYDKSGRPVNAKPCSICEDMLKHTPIKVIEHT